MNKVIFYKVAWFHRGIELGEPEKATKRKLFECYCVNQHQIDQIKNYLLGSLSFDETHGNIFRYGIGYHKLATKEVNE